MRLLAAFTVALVLAPAAQAERAHVGYPSAIAALGDSDSTGFDTVTPNRDSPQNSWSTGTNAAVDSLYTRILGANSRIKGHAWNFARDGSGVADLLIQARLAVGKHAEYVTVETGGNDVCNGARPMPLSLFKTRYVDALRTLAVGVPNARILATSIPWSVRGYNATFGPYFAAHGYVSDGSACDPGWDAAGHANPTRDAALEQLFASYDAAIASACAKFLHCRFDGRALAGLTPTLDDFSFLKPDDPYVYTHPSVEGLAKMADAAWGAGFDFGDRKAPVSRATRAGRLVTLTATDAAGIELRWRPTGAWTRYAKPLKLTKGATLTWRAVDANGNCEASHSLKG